jgi:predicted MFS family arabinose efflux permease
MLALAVAMGIGRFVLTPILPFMIESLGLTHSQAGLIAAANFAGYFLGAFGAALPALPGGRRAWLILALAASALSTALMGATSNLAVFIALRFAGGVASAFVLVIGSALVLDTLAQSGRGTLVALHFAGIGAGIAVSAILIAGLTALGVGWSGFWMWSGALSLVGTGIAAWLVRNCVEAPQLQRTAPDSAANRTFVLTLIAYGLFGFGYVITATFISTIVHTQTSLHPIEPYIWLIFGLAAAPSVALWNWIARKSRVTTSFICACIAEALGVASSAIGTHATEQIAAALLLGGTFVGLTALGLTRARDLSSGDPRRSLALMTAAFGFGQIIGPLFAGYAAQITGGFRTPSLVAAAALVLAGVCVTVSTFRDAA